MTGGRLESSCGVCPGASSRCAEGLGEGYSGHSGRVGLAIRMTSRGAPSSGGADSRALEVSVDARKIHEGREGT